MLVKKINRLDFLKIADFFSTKEIIKRVARQATEWEKVFSHIMHSTVSHIKRTLLNQYEKKAHNPKEK